DAGRLGNGALFEIETRDGVVVRPTRIAWRPAPVPAVHRRNRIIPAQAMVHGVEEARAVAAKTAAKAAAAGHIELAVPILGRQPDFKVDRRPHKAEHTAGRRSSTQA